MFTLRIIRNPLVQDVKLLIAKADGTYSYHWAERRNVVEIFAQKDCHLEWLLITVVAGWLVGRGV